MDLVGPELVSGPQATGRELLVAEVERFEDWPDAIDLPAPHFVLFVAADAVGADRRVLVEFAAKLVAQGAAYACAWGADCERLHDAFDIAREAAHPDPQASGVVMTTRHDDETLDEALWFALFAAHPDEELTTSCDSVLAVSVGSEEWGAWIRRRLADPGGLAKDVL